MPDDIDATSDVGKHAAALVAAIWAAAGDISKPIDAGAAQPGSMVDRLHAAVRRRLAKSHPSLLNVRITKRPCRKRRLELYAGKRPASTRIWRPSRPALSKEIVRLVGSGVGLTTVPADKRCVCALPLKIFARDVAEAATASDASLGFSNRSVQYAVAEVMSVIVSEAEMTAEADAAAEAGAFELHSSTDAAWAGTAARGSGIAMNEMGKEAIFSAAKRVAERLAQTELTRRPLEGVAYE